MLYKNIKYAALIPARKNSKRVKDKNTILINKKPLIEYTLEAAIKSKKIDMVIVSSNDKKILSLQKKYKDLIFIKRPNNLCLDNSSTETAMLHAIKILEKKKFNLVNLILLQATSPFRDNNDIDNAIIDFEKKKLDSLISVNKKKIFLWKKDKKKFFPITYNFNNRQMTQKMDEYYVENGAIFISMVKKFKQSKSRLFGKIGFYEMEHLNSLELDDEKDLNYIRLIAKTI